MTTVLYYLGAFFHTFALRFVVLVDQALCPKCAELPLTWCWKDKTKTFTQKEIKTMGGI